MADTANISFIFSTNAESVTDSIKKLRDANERLAASLDDVQDQANQADDSLDDLAVSSVRADTAMSNFNGTSVSTNLSLGKLAGGLLTVEAAKKALELATRVAIATFNTYIETNDQARARAEALTGQIGLLKTQFAEAALGGGNFEEIMTAAEQAISGISEALVTLTPLINTLTNEYIVKNIQYVSDLVTIYNSLIGAFNRLAEAIPILGQVTDAIGQAIYYTNPMNLLRESIGGIADTIRSREDDLVEPIVQMGVAAGTTTDILTDLTSEIANTEQMINATTPGFSLYAEAWGMVSEGMDLAGESSRSYSSGAREAEQATKDLDASLKALAAGTINVQTTQKIATDLTLEDLARLSEGYKEAARLQAEKTTASIKVPTIGGGLSIDDKAAEAMKAAQGRLDGFKASVKDAAIEIATSGLTDGLAMMGETFGALLAGDEAFAKNFGKNSLKLLGKMISSFGQVLIAEGVGISLADPSTGGFPNPARGGPVIGAGAAAVVLGSALGYSGGGGKKSSGGGSATPTPQASQPVQNVYNVSTNVGMVGDQRAFGRELSYQQEKQKRMGL